jgi:alkylhydroperoxidase/carboxymuconolactone decarboxylase family protein YurZ
MAITLSVPLTDAEQARILQVAAVVAPGASGPQIKAWAEGVCKQALREAVQVHAVRAADEAANTARREALDALGADWPSEVVVPEV